MSKLVNGVWEHRMWCNYFMKEGPCWCCDAHQKWPYASDLMKETNKTKEQVVEDEINKNYPDVVIRKGT